MSRIVYVELPRGARAPRGATVVSRRKATARGRAPVIPGGAANLLAAAALVAGVAVMVNFSHGGAPLATHAAAGVPSAPARAAVHAVTAAAAGLPANAGGSGGPWSVFSQGGGRAVAVTWARDLLTAAGLPVSAANIQFIYDWELNEGGGGKYNPLNQGPVPGRPELTSTGQRYGGGAADYVSWQAGITGGAAYLNMPDYAGVLAALKDSDYHAAAVALWKSPWARSHYGYGSAWLIAATGST